eukprot:364804-Chlamydomonas_euryale.AAC.2
MHILRQGSRNRKVVQTHMATQPCSACFARPPTVQCTMYVHDMKPCFRTTVSFASHTYTYSPTGHPMHATRHVQKNNLGSERSIPGLSPPLPNPHGCMATPQPTRLRLQRQAGVKVPHPCRVHHVEPPYPVTTCTSPAQSTRVRGNPAAYPFAIATSGRCKGAPVMECIMSSLPIP